MVKNVTEFLVDAEMPRARVALLLEHFSHLEDDREPQRVMYPLSEVLLLVTCATIASCDDFDEIEDNILRERSGRWRVKAQTDIVDFNEQFGSHFPDDEHDTVGGLVISLFGRLPKRGESIAVDGFKFLVQRADSRRVHTLVVERAQETI